MLAYGVVIGDPARYEAWARMGVDRVRTPETLELTRRGRRSIAEAYNGILAEASGRAGLEGLVLIHQDLEILDASFEDVARRALAEPGVAVAGAVGARDVRSLAWWRGDGRGRLAETRGVVDFGGGRHDVDCVDGSLLVLSPWAARTLRFDESLPGFHGYDVDLCFQARARGGRVVVDEFPAFHHTLGGYGRPSAWLRADHRWRRKWGIDPSWRRTFVTATRTARAAR